MRLVSIHIEGWRSFAPGVGITLRDLGSLNVLIGPNNAGKSNVGRFLLFVRKILRDNESSWKATTSQNFQVAIGVNGDLLEGDHWMRDDRGRISATLMIERSAGVFPIGADPVIVRIDIRDNLPARRCEFTLVPLMPDGQPLVR